MKIGKTNLIKNNYNKFNSSKAQSQLKARIIINLIISKKWHLINKQKVFLYKNNRIHQMIQTIKVVQFLISTLI